MNEFHRQEYLSLMGIEQYIPRWKIPFAAESNLLEFARLEDNLVEVNVSEVLGEAVETTNVDSGVNIPNEYSSQSLSITSLLDDFQAKQNPARFARNEKASQVIEQEKTLQLRPFTLSVWRPEAGFLIIASRNIEAMPTELLLNNLLRFYLRKTQLHLSEEFLRWPAVENSQMLRTEEAAKTEMQTWLSVQHELQPIEKIWFFGETHHFFMDNAVVLNFDKVISSCEISLNSSPSSSSLIKVKILPELSRFLLQPLLKTELLLLE